MTKNMGLLSFIVSFHLLVSSSFHVINSKNPSDFLTNYDKGIKEKIKYVCL